jgi:hypothetical protein
MSDENSSAAKSQNDDLGDLDHERERADPEVDRE